MKRFFVTLVALFVALLTAEAQGLGQLYDNGQVRGIVVKLTPDGQPAVIASLQVCNERLCDDKDATTMPAANSVNDGRQNMQAIEQYIAQHGGSFPAYDWCKSLGPGWYLPARNEVYDAWIVTFGGEDGLDNYDQDLFLATTEVVKKAKGDKMVWDKNEPIPWISSTMEQFTHPKKGHTIFCLRAVYLHESKGSMVGGFAVDGLRQSIGGIAGIVADSKVRSRKGGKIGTSYRVPTMKGGTVGGFRAFYRLREDAYAAGIYEAPEPDRSFATDTSDAASTQLVSTNEPAPAPTPAPAQQPAPQPAPQAAPAPKAAPAPVQQPAPAPQYQQPAQPQYQAAPQPAQQQVVYANNTGWDIIIAPGQDIQCRVLRVGEKEIEYKKAGFENGPTYTISRRKAEKIIYANGQTEDVKKGMLDFIKKR